MAKALAVYFCSECGASHSKWTGKCTDCGSWNSIVEEKVSHSPFVSSSKQKSILASSSAELTTLDANISDVARTTTGISELDRVLGGGLVEGSAILIGGDPGIGKSTILLQTAIALGNKGFECIYLSGEESVDQIKLRASRLNLLSNQVKLASVTSLSDINGIINKGNIPKLLIIDSIQTIYHEAIESAPGSVSQVRACAFELIRQAKSKGFTIVLVGHVTKDGSIAGPKVLEHMVDTVLYFEGDRGQQYRIIRAVKNRFGSANEIGVFEMQSEGLVEVSNPSSLFLPINQELVSGSCIFAGIEGTRPLLVEIQALVVPSFLATPRRAVVGWDQNRLSMLIAVLNSRYGVSVLDKEVYLNIAGGMRVVEPAADLAAMAAIISAAINVAIPRNTIFFGEVGLSGELRPVTNTESRILEAEKLGFERAVIPTTSKMKACNLEIINLNHIKELYKIFKS